MATLMFAAAIGSGCANVSHSAPIAQDSVPAGKHLAAEVSGAAQIPTTGGGDDSDAELETLWRERTAATATPSSGFTLGPGDVLRISVPMISQLTDRTVRVSEDDTISLPLLGTIKVAGMTEQDLRQDLSSRLGRYMYNPQVEVYLQTPENRVVSVLGTVKAPGRYLVTSHSDSIMTLLSRAGGTTELAGSQILLFPVPSNSSSAPPERPSEEAALADPSRGQTTNALANYQATRSAQGITDAEESSLQSPMLVETEKGAPLVISAIGPERYLNMPVRPGDVLLVPAAGSVSVQGWVDKPGLFAITPGMTALGSVAAAGGALFTSSATLVRGGPAGGRRQIALNLTRIKRGEEADVPVQGGDVIIVERSAAGAIPYSLYFLANKLGVGVPIIP